MSFYYGQQQPNPFSSPAGNRHPPFNFFNQGPPPSHHFGPRHPYHIYRQHPFFAAQQYFDDEPQEHHSPSPSAPAARQSLDDEEQAALAHLEAIRKRKAAEQESIKREAEARLKAKREREIAIQRAIAEKEREEAISRLVRQKEEEYARQLSIRKAIEIKRAEEIQRRREQYLAAQEAKQRYIHEVIAKKAECAKRHAARYAAHASKQAVKEAQRQYGGEFEQLNKVLGGLFGINLASEEVEEKKEVKVEKKEEVNEKKEVHFDQPQSSLSSASTSNSNDKKENSFPEDINDILGQFLGLRVEPTTESKPTSGPTENKVPAGLNEFLSQFGLVFEFEESSETKEEEKPTLESATTVNKAPIADPEVPALPAPITTPTAPVPTSASASSSVPKSTPKVDDAPLTAFLNSFTDLPPFVRDILGNVELAFKEELNNKKEEEVVKGKGKGVASGEKNPVVTPSAPSAPNQPKPEASPAVKDSSKSLDKLNSIASELSLVKESFEFPSILAFASTSESSESNDIVPNLLYNKTNKSYHAQSNKLLQLLLDADSVESEGNKEVRKLRKEIVGAVEDSIKELEGRRDEIWKEVKERREKGEEFELWEDESSLSSRSSVVDIEHVEDVKGFEVEDNQPSNGTVLFDAPVDTEEENQVKEREEEVEEDKVIAGDRTVEVKASEEKVEKVEKASDDKKVVENVEEKDKVAKVEDAKEEGYELL